MNTRVHMVVLCKGVKKCMTFMFFRAQFGQSRSFNSLSHKNLIMNMEPLVPALPSTNEYEETAVDSGRRILLTTDPNTHNRHSGTFVKSHGIFLVWEEIHAQNSEREL